MQDITIMGNCIVENMPDCSEKNSIYSSDKKTGTMLVAQQIAHYVT